MTFKLAVFGNPIAHSLSPQIHHLFADEVGIDLRYEKTLVESENFKDEVNRFFEHGGKGLNITVPHKELAFNLANSRSDKAEQAEAVNTLLLNSHGVLHGENTDGWGLLKDIEHNLNWRIEGKRVLLLGAGGASQGVLGDLLQRQPDQLTVANRTFERAKTLVGRFHGNNLTAIPLSDLSGSGAFDLIISASSGGLTDSPQTSEQYMPESLLHPESCCYDMIYGRPTPFLNWATTALGREQLSDGFGMLVEQAARSFQLWFDVEVSTQPVLKQLRTSQHT